MRSRVPIGGRALPLTYQALVADTPSTLDRLRAFLDLDTGFTDRYDMQPFTGRRGDPSDTIRAGRIVRDREPPRVEIPADVLWDEQLSPQAEALLWMGNTAEAGHYVSVAGLRQGIDRYNEVLQLVCDELRVACIDLRPLRGRAEFFYDDCHFNEAGAREVAGIVAPRLSAELGLRASPRTAGTDW